MKIDTVAEFDAALAAGPYAWPGGYPCFFLVDDGETLSFAAAKDEAHQIRDAISTRTNNGWRIIAVEVNWEDPELYCAHTNERIPSAYAEPD